MPYERTQKENPHRLTLKQHTFPVKSISRFTNKTGRVEVFYFSENRRFEVKPDHELFCAKRVWDEKSEKGYMLEIESNFQIIAERIINSNGQCLFSSMDKKNINRFYALWSLRDHYKHNPEDDIELFRSTESGWSKDDQEEIEKAGVYFLDNAGSVKGRLLVGINMATQIGDICEKIMDAEWGVLKSDNVEFIVPDRPQRLAIPVTPTFCLHYKSTNCSISDEKVNFVNQWHLGSCRQYCFARKLPEQYNNDLHVNSKPR